MRVALLLTAMATVASARLHTIRPTKVTLRPRMESQKSVLDIRGR